MKKTFIIFILALFMFSIVPVYAQDTAANDAEVTGSTRDSGKMVEKREALQEKRAEVRGNIQENRKRVKDLVESKIKNTSAFERNMLLERNRILRVSEKIEGTDSFIEKLTPEDTEKFLKLSRAEQIKIIKENKPEMLRKLKIMKVTDEEFKARDVSKERIIESINKYRGARKDAKEIRDGLKETRGVVKNAQTEEEKIASAKDYLTKIVDAEIAELQSLKERVINNQDITSEESSDSTAKIDEAITKLGELKTKISSATTLQELRGIVKDIKKYAMLKYIHRTRAVAANICHGVLKRSEHLERKAESVLATAEEKGEDTAQLNTQIDELSTLLETAKSQCADAKTAFDSARDIEESEAKKTAVKSFIGATKKAAETVKQAHQKLVEIRATAKSLSLDVDTEKVEEVAEAEGGENA
ncbi:hypothetical protein HY500_01250 [Candidatus Woesearchaeota archaeon]|nr:hypothetical protein [Candidatus Woesearchaeota archaeon]